MIASESRAKLAIQWAGYPSKTPYGILKRMDEQRDELLVRRVAQLLRSGPLRPREIVGELRRGGLAADRWDVGVLLRRRPDVFSQGDDYRWRLVGASQEGPQMRFDIPDQERTPIDGDAR